MNARKARGREMRLVTKEQAQAYVDAVSKTDDFQPCRYGHGHCALVAGGLCANEVAVEFGLDDSEV